MHAFPDRQKGKIVVAYRCSGETWKLSVTDDGVGIPESRAVRPSGLGTHLIEALAGQLTARLELTNANPGTVVSITHP